MPLIAESNHSSGHNASPDAYEALLIEARWQKQWSDSHLYRTTQPRGDDKTFYALSMFPYPSGTLHMGHVRNYVITDVIARVQRMRGYSVLHPMGWDSFGLPAENAAIERNIDPGEWTRNNIIQMKKQLSRLGLSIDWDLEQTTCDVDYYKWTQYLFLQLYQKGLAYQNQATVNWDPIDQTVLANEQVDSEGRSWRSGAIVEQKKLKQWFLRITDYAEQLDTDLDKLTNWPDKVKSMQRNWIGKSEGTEVDFIIEGDNDLKITIFTTRLDTIYGATYLAVAPENEIINKLFPNDKSDHINQYIHNAAKLSQIERTDDKRPKTGIDLGIKAINPINKERIPVYLADYVISEYGSGAVMGVPAHDKRDYTFATKYQLPIKFVVTPDEDNSDSFYNKPFTSKGILVNSAQFSGLKSDIANIKILKRGTTSNWARTKIQYRLRDWLISRQRYWGCPIPIIKCKSCGIVPVPYSQLPVELPESHNLSSKVGNPLESNVDWVTTKCPNCERPAIRETDTMDTFMCSSWYYLRYADPGNKSKPFNNESISTWLPVNQYVGGIEHAILHLLYARFFTKALYNNKLISINEPFTSLLTQGMVQGITYRNKKTNKYIPIDSISDRSKPIDPSTGDELEIIYEKMSKSKYNGVDPSTVINKYGADTARMFILFKAPPEKDLEWNDADVEGQYRFLNRLWKLFSNIKLDSNNKDVLSDQYVPLAQKDIDKTVLRAVSYTIKALDDDLSDKYQFNTAISELMKLSNLLSTELENLSSDLKIYSLNVLVKLLAPFSPHLAEELWLKLGGTGSVHLQSWPRYDKNNLISESINLVIQIKGKTRGTIKVESGLSKNNLEEIAINSDIAKRWLNNAKPNRVIVIPDKLVNLIP